MIKTVPDSGGKLRMFGKRTKMLNRFMSYIGGKIANLIRAKLVKMQEEEENEMNEAQNVVLEKKEEENKKLALDEAAKRKARWEANQAKKAKTAGR